MSRPRRGRAWWKPWAPAALVVLTCRPEYEANWESKDCVTRVDLDPLESMLPTSWFGPCWVTVQPRGVARLIVERTGGTPLFIEETVRTLVESGVLRARDGGYELTREIREIRSPKRCNR